MTDLRRRALLVLVLLWALPALACVNPSDPFGNESDFRLIQKHFTQYVRWGKVRQAAGFVVPEQRAEFLALGPDLTDIRFPTGRPSRSTTRVMRRARTCSCAAIA